jgi:hypothetical protein
MSEWRLLSCFVDSVSITWYQYTARLASERAIGKYTFRMGGSRVFWVMRPAISSAAGLASPPSSPEPARELANPSRCRPSAWVVSPPASQATCLSQVSLFCRRRRGTFAKSSPSFLKASTHSRRLYASRSGPACPSCLPWLVRRRAPPNLRGRGSTRSGQRDQHVFSAGLATGASTGASCLATHRRPPMTLPGQAINLHHCGWAASRI